MKKSFLLFILILGSTALSATQTPQETVVLHQNTALSQPQVNKQLLKAWLTILTSIFKPRTIKVKTKESWATITDLYNKGYKKTVIFTACEIGAVIGIPVVVVLGIVTYGVVKGIWRWQEEKKNSTYIYKKITDDDPSNRSSTAENDGFFKRWTKRFSTIFNKNGYGNI
jgi:hypothetical protein